MCYRLSSLYDPFGNAITVGQASPYPYLFRGMEYDATGLYNARGIYYSQNLGRPLPQVTPVGGQGGINVSVLSAQGSGGGLGGIEEYCGQRCCESRDWGPIRIVPVLRGLLFGPIFRSRYRRGADSLGGHGYKNRNCVYPGFFRI